MAATSKIRAHRTRARSRKQQKFQQIDFGWTRANKYEIRRLASNPGIPEYMHTGMIWGVAPTKGADIKVGGSIDPVRALNGLFEVGRLHHEWDRAPHGDRRAMLRRMKGDRMVEGAHESMRARYYEPNLKEKQRHRPKFETRLLEWCNAYGLPGLRPTERWCEGGMSAWPTDRHKFWKKYAEPIADILDTATLFQRVALRFAGHPNPDVDTVFGGEVPTLGRLNNYAQLSQVVLGERKNGSAVTGNQADTLCAFLADALIHAPELGWRFDICKAEGCGLAFVVADKRQKYCGPRCLKRQHMRNKKAAAKA